MDRSKKLDRWAEKLLDTGKRNSLINFRDYKTSSAEVVYPDCESLFSKCSLGRQFSIFDPHIVDEDIIYGDTKARERVKALPKYDYREVFSGKIKNTKTLLLYSHGANPIAAIKRIAKKAKDQADETGNNVAYLAFGFVNWNEKEGGVYYRAPLLLVHINIITGSILDPVKIEISDDDIVVNPTFSYLVKTEYGLKLPDYRDEETLSSYYSRVSKVVGQLGWDVVNECKVGIFSFLKINMYEDIKKNADSILSNRLINVLVGEPMNEASSDTYGDESVCNPLIDLHAVVEADSSQIQAIEMAKKGKSFVLQGPPGTGKSQTITNIIAECLYDGKKVLFVSEKQAALNVVYDKLKKAGLSDFCLELHSHKANKKAVIDELNRTLELPKISVSSLIQNEIYQKEAAQKTLDSYERELHAKRDPINRSFFELLEEYSAHEYDVDYSVNISNIERKGDTYLYNAISLLEQYAAILPLIGYDYTQCAWYGFNRANLNYDETNALLDDLEDLVTGLIELQKITIDYSSRYELDELNYSLAKVWSRYLYYLGTSDVITPGLLVESTCKDLRDRILELKDHCDRIQSVRRSITDVYDDKVIQDFDGVQLYNKLTVEYGNAIKRFFSSDFKSLITQIQSYSKRQVKIKYQDAVELAQNLIHYQGVQKPFYDIENDISEYLGICYNGLDTDWDHMIAGINEIINLHNIGMPEFGLVQNMSKEQFVFCRSSFEVDAEKLSDELSKISDALYRVNSMFYSGVLDLENDGIDKCIRIIQRCIDEFESLSSWKRFKELVDQFNSSEMSDYIDYLTANQPDPQTIVAAYEKSFYKSWIEHILKTVPELGRFSRKDQENAIEIFRVKDALQYEINKVQINAKISKKRPNVKLVANGSAVGILREEGQKKRKQKSIRTLLSETGSLVQTLKPCFLMSPLSVSTFLDSDRIRFDTVVFDEASQIFPQDALGAIYRGKQLIVVGDSKQMPPSNFFSTSTDSDEDDEDDVYDITDFESILDVCGAIFDTQKLAWHYRSRYEQLIAFSNVNFYDNELITFPSATKNQKGIGVDYYYVDGIFDRPSKTNLGEAEFIVDRIFEHIDKYPERSLGVVAFSVAQQSLIDKLLSKKREECPEFEWFFNDEGTEPFFIKNLETVQGDERDTIIFSVAYARDADGRFIHNFGPLNREGGERRLNVAVTRAKENVQLIASIHYSDINLNNTRSEGVRLLRSYLEYAQNGDVAIERKSSYESTRKDNALENEICELLKDRGFSVETKIGYSEERIDIGVREGKESNYLIAIECDGYVYHSAKNARDRDCLRQRVLENMGWKYYRIWSTDWYKNRELEQERLLRFVLDSLDNGAADPAVAKFRDSIIASSQGNILNGYVSMYSEQDHPFEPYKEQGALSVIQNHFNFIAGIRAILDDEAPLSEEYLLRRIVNLFGREKVTKVVIEEFDKRMRACKNYGIVRKKGYMYLPDDTSNMIAVPNSNVVLYRLRIPGVSREIKYIAPEELAGGMYYIIQQNNTVTKDGLYKYMTNVLGFNRTGENIVEKYDEALTILTRAKLVKKNRGELTLINGT